MTEEWLIDGYNLLHATPSSRSSKSARELGSWLAQLAGFASLKQVSTTVVLDGTGDAAELEIHRTPLFNVVYSQKISADAFIERRLYEGRDKTSFVVVTDDRAISNIARGAGSRVICTRDFLETLKETRNESSESLQKGRVRSHGFNRPFDDKLKDR